MREILNEIFTWSWYSESHGYNFNGHLIRHAEGNLCIDPVEPGEEGLDEIARLGATRILLTNRNHSRASNKVRERTGARASIHPDEAAHARDQGTALDDALTVAQTIGPLLVVGGPWKVVRRGGAPLAGAAPSNRRRRRDRQPARAVRASARTGDGRTAAPQGKRAFAFGPGLRHPAGGRRRLHPRRREGPPQGPGRFLSRLREAASPGHRRSGRPWARLD